MFSELAFWQEIALIGLAGLALLYVFTFRIWAAIATGADLLFALALLFCILSIASPTTFLAAARLVNEASPLPAVLIAADDRLDALEALPGELVAGALAKVGYTVSSDDEDDIHERDATLPRTNAEGASGIALIPDRVEGRIESSVRPAVESLIALVLRASTFASSFFLLLVALALRSSTATTRQLQQITARLVALEERGTEPAT